MGPYLIVLSAWIGLYFVLDLGWVPIDDGTLAHMADRVNGGELPHRDFQDVYTGGLTYWNAAALRWFGYDLLSLRLLHWLLALTWMVGFYWLAKRMLSPLRAAWATALLTAVPLFMHLTPMPSWHNVMFGTFALLSAVKFSETDQRRWLVVAGFMVGVGFLAKSPGLYFALAVGVFLAVRVVRSGHRDQVVSGRTALILACVVVAALLMGLPSLHRYLVFLLPLALLVGAEWTAPEQASPAVQTNFIAEVGAFVAGLAVPVGGFAAFLWANDGLSQAIHSMLAVPGSVLAVAGDFPHLLTLATPILFGYLVVRLPRSGSRRAGALLLAGTTVLLVAMYRVAPIETLLVGLQIVFWSALLGGVVYVWCRRELGPLPLPVVAVVSGALCAALLGYPAFTEYQAFFILPVGGLGVVAIATMKNDAYGVRVLIGLSFVCAVFVVGKLETKFMSQTAIGWSTGYVDLESERSGIRIPAAFAFYNPLIRSIRQRSDLDPTLTFVAGPNSPEVYFLSGMDSPTPLVLDSSPTNFGESARLTAILESGSVDLFANHLRPLGTRPLPLADWNFGTPEETHIWFELYDLRERG